eukprot:757023-Hanusia_phi.AAC.5
MNQSQKKIIGNDKQESSILVQTEWTDYHSIASVLSMPREAGAGQLAVLDLSGCTEVSPQILHNTLQGVGKLKELLVASMDPACSPVIVQGLINSMWKSGYAVPQAWRAGAEFAVGQKGTYMPGRLVAVRGLGHGWEQKQTAEGKLYYSNHIRQTTQWEAPGGGFVFGQLAGVKDVDNWVVNVEGETRVLPVAEIGMISPQLRPWAISLRVLDISDLRVEAPLLQLLAECIVLMPSLSTIKQRNVNPAFLLNAIKSCWDIGGTLPPLQQIDLSQVHKGAVYDWSALVPALLAVKSSLSAHGSEITLSGIFSSCNPAQQMQIFADLLMALDMNSLSSSVIEVPPAAGTQTSVLSELVHKSRFQGILGMRMDREKDARIGRGWGRDSDESTGGARRGGEEGGEERNGSEAADCQLADCSNKSLRIVVATIQGMKRNPSLSGLFLRQIEKLPNQMYPFGDAVRGRVEQRGVDQSSREGSAGMVGREKVGAGNNEERGGGESWIDEAMAREEKRAGEDDDEGISDSQSADVLQGDGGAAAAESDDQAA